MDNLTLTYNGNQLTGVSDASADYDFAGSFEYKRANGSQYIYDRNGSLVADKSRGIAYITYDSNNNPSRIYFTNGNVTKYRYSATGQKLSVEYYVAAPNVTVPFGTEPDALTQGQTMYAGSKQYLLGGSLVMEDGMIDKFLFDGGYAKASAVNPTTYNFSFNYYNQDHLGNNREVVDSAGTVRQITHYYPFGTPYADPSTVLGATLQPYKYNGKELDRMHGLDTYDYGARQYAPILGRWDRMDPLCEKYYSISPYAYCMNNPVNLIDPIGMEPVYNMDGEFLGTTSEGFTGDVMIYSGFMKINFESYTRKMLEENMSDYFRTYDTVNGSNRDGLSNDTKSKIWTDLVSHFEGTQIYDEKFSMSTILGGVIEFKDIGSNHWLSEHNYNEHYGSIRGGDRYKESYETTVENLASSIIVHEWYTHIRKDAGKRFKSHRLAYKNVINWKPFWDKTTDRYKFFCLWQLQYYTKKETGRSQVDPIYRNLFNRYVK